MQASALKCNIPDGKKTSHAHSTVFYTVCHILFDMSYVCHAFKPAQLAMGIGQACLCMKEVLCASQKKSYLWVFSNMHLSNRKRCTLIYCLLLSHIIKLICQYFCESLVYEWESFYLQHSNEAVNVILCQFALWNCDLAGKTFDWMGLLFYQKRVKKTHPPFFHASVNYVWIGSI